MLRVIKQEQKKIEGKYWMNIEDDAEAVCYYFFFVHEWNYLFLCYVNFEFLFLTFNALSSNGIYTPNVINSSNIELLPCLIVKLLSLFLYVLYNQKF